MKKLLALILCVMMFVAVIPTAAFATETWDPEFEVGGTNNTEVNGWFKASVNKDAIDDLNDAIADMYSALAANQTVFATAQGMHSLADNLAKGLLANIDDFTFTVKVDNEKKDITFSHDQLVDNSRAFLKAVIGAEIKSYMDKRAAAYLDDEDEIDDYDAYLKTYIAAVNNALTSSKAQKGIEAFAYALATMAIYDDVNDKLDDLRDELIAWNDYGDTKWGEFGFTPAADDFDDLFNDIDSTVFVPGTGLTNDQLQTAYDIASGDAAKLIREYAPVL